MLQRVTVNPIKLMEDLGENYQASPNYRMMNRRHRPYFHGWWIEEMLTSPKIQQALSIIKGPIVTKAKFEVITDDTEIKEQVQNYIDRFFLIAADSVLGALEYGFSVHEFIYEPDPGTKDLNLVDINYFKPYDTKPCIDKYSNKFDGFWVPDIKTYIKRPKAFHFAHDRKFDKILGRSILHSAFLPWIEEWAVGGLRDIRKLWYAKMCYNSGTLYHPPGSTRLRDGTEIENAELAQKMAQKAATGHIMTIELEHGDAVEIGSGGSVRAKWYYEPGNVNSVPPGLLETVKNVKDEQLEAMGIPPEIIQAEDGGAGGTGRSIPVDLYYTTLQKILNSLTWSMYKNYVLPLLQLNTGKTLDKLPEVKIRAFELGQETFIDEEGNMVESDNAAQDIAEQNKAEEARKVQNEPSVQRTRDANKQKAEFGKRGKSTKTS
jgi:hypothetical protein